MNWWWLDSSESNCGEVGVFEVFVVNKCSSKFGGFKSFYSYG